MNYYITKLKLSFFDLIKFLSRNTMNWAAGHADIIRLGIHENETTGKVRIINMKEKWSNFLRRMRKVPLSSYPFTSTKPILDNIRSTATPVEVDHERLKWVEENSEDTIRK